MAALDWLERCLATTCCAHQDSLRVAQSNSCRPLARGQPADRLVWPRCVWEPAERRQQVGAASRTLLSRPILPMAEAKEALLGEPSLKRLLPRGDSPAQQVAGVRVQFNYANNKIDQPAASPSWPSARRRRTGGGCRESESAARVRLPPGRRSSGLVARKGQSIGPSSACSPAARFLSA